MSILKPLNLSPAQQIEASHIFDAETSEDLWESICALIKSRDDARRERDDLSRTRDAYKKLLDKIGFYFEGTENNHVSEKVLQCFRDNP